MRYLDRLTAIRIREGDVEAFEALINTYQSRVFSYCLRMINDYGAAEDLTQEIFLKVYRGIRTYDWQAGRLSTWIYAITRNTCINHLRTQDRRVTETKVSGDELSRQRSPNLFSHLEDRIRLVAALNKLSPEDRDIVLWKDYLDLKYREIGDMLGLPIGTVKSRLFSIRQRLRQELEGEGQ